jgi:hypothetical protein
MSTSHIQRDGSTPILTSETLAVVRQLRAAAAGWLLLGGRDPIVRRRTYALSALARHLHAGDRAGAAAALDRARHSLGGVAAPRRRRGRATIRDLAIHMGLTALDRAEAWLRGAPAARP